MDNMGEFTSFSVNGKTYNIKNFSVFEALSFHIEFMATMGGFIGSAISLFNNKGEEPKKGKNAPQGKKTGNDEIAELFAKIKPEETERLMKKVLSRVITPEQICLENQAAANDWFGRPENAGDLWLVCLNGLVSLVGEYLPSGLNTALLGFKKVLAGLSALSPDNASMPLSGSR